MFGRFAKKFPYLPWARPGQPFPPAMQLRPWVQPGCSRWTVQSCWFHPLSCQRSRLHLLIHAILLPHSSRRQLSDCLNTTDFSGADGFLAFAVPNDNRLAHPSPQGRDDEITRLNVLYPGRRRWHLRAWTCLRRWAGEDDDSRSLRFDHLFSISTCGNGAA